MSPRTPALVLLLATCTPRPPPDAPEPASTGAPASTPPAEPVAAEPVVVADPPPPETPPEAPPLAAADPPPLRTPPPPENSPAAITVAIASVQISGDCPDEPSPAATAAKPVDASRSESRSSITKEESERQSRCQQSTLQLALTNTGGRPGKLHLEQVRLLDGKTRRVLGTLPSRNPSHWRADTYQPWDEQIAGNALTQASYRLGDVVWNTNTVFALGVQPYFVEIAYTIDGHKKITRSAEIVPRNFDMIET